MKHKELNCSGFPAAYASLHSLKQIQASRLALARSVIALGPARLHHDLAGAMWWTLRGCSTVFSLLHADLRPTYGFRMQTASQRKTDAFLLAEALTRWFAQTHLKASVVTPLEAHTGTLGKAARKTPYPKAMPKGFRTSVYAGLKAEPDFLAFSSQTDVHVLESKGRAAFGPVGLTDKAIVEARNKALRQVCRVATVNGLTPVTRTACVFGFGSRELIGQVTDPPETDQFDYRAELPGLIERAYASVLDPSCRQYMQPMDGDFVGFEFAPGWRYGVHRGVYERLVSLRGEDSVAGLFEFLTEFRAGGSRLAGGIDVGPDGLMIAGKYDPRDDDMDFWHD